MITLYFQKAGLLTTIQDKGRIGYQEFGVPVSGAMDQGAAQLANWLVNNPPSAPVLEITLLGPTIEIEGSAQIAITGADLSPKLNRQAIPMYETLTINQKAILSFGRINSGCRAYLAIGGNWMVKKWLGSASAATSAPKDLTPNSIIEKNSNLQIQHPTSFIPKRIHKPTTQLMDTETLRISVLPGPEFEAFSNYNIGHFFSQGYQISNDSNRMGYRLIGKALDFRPSKEVISSGIVPGTIQISNSGQPIILMRDAQTTGGYYRIANVLNAGLNQLAQAKPGTFVWFTLQ